MKIRFLNQLILLPLLFSSNLLFAQSYLKISEKFKLISVNGQTYSRSLLQNETELQLNPGINKIALKYEAVFEKEDDDGFDIIKSDIFIVSFYLQKNNHYRLQHLKQANSKAARKFVQNPLISIVDMQDKKIETKQFFPDSQSIGLILQNTQTKLKQQKIVRLETKAPSIKLISNNNTHQPDAEKMLLFWWQQANQQQRQRFLDKIIPSN